MPKPSSRSWRDDGSDVGEGRAVSVLRRAGSVDRGCPHGTACIYNKSETTANINVPDHRMHASFACVLASLPRLRPDGLCYKPFDKRLPRCYTSQPLAIVAK